MNWKKATVIIVLACLAVLLIWDFVAMGFGGDSATISNVLINAFHKYPFVTFLTGYVFGHLTWRMAPTKEIDETIKKYEIRRDK